MRSKINSIVTFARNRWSIIILLLVGIILIYHFFIATPSKTIVDKSTVERGTVEEKLTISGQIDAENKVTLEFPTGGKISWVGVKVGDHVKKYQTIAALDATSLQKTLQKDLNDYKKTRNNFDQTGDDNKSQVINDSLKRILEDSQADLNNSVIDVEIQNLALTLANLTSPIDGLVTRVTSPLPGVIISTPAQAEFDVVDPTSIYFSATADQTEIVKLSSSQSGQLILDAYPDQTIDGKITDIAFTPKEGETGTVYEVKLTFPVDNSSYQYRLGMTGDLTFTTNKKDNVLFVAPKFVKSDGSKKYVEELVSGKPQKFFVTTGLETDDRTEIVSGLSLGDKVVLTK